jgi:hypothetical protein
MAFDEKRAAEQELEGLTAGAGDGIQSSGG